MTRVTIELPDDLAHRLEAIAAAEKKTVQQLTVERLTSLAIPDSPSALLNALTELPRFTDAELDEVEAAIGAGRLPVRDEDPFRPDSAE